MGRCRRSQADRTRGDRGGGEGEGGLTRVSAWRWCLFGGLVTLAVSRAFGWIPDLAPCGDGGGAGAVIAAEMVRSPQQLADLFWNPALGQTCAVRLETALGRSLWLDMLAFIPAYTVFLAAGALALGGRVARITAGAVILAGLLDLIEGVVLFQLIAAWESPPALFDALFWTVRPKFALLGLAAMLIGATLARRNWPGALVGVAIGGGGLVSLWMLFTAPRDPLMMQGHAIAWVALLLVALIGAVRPSFWTSSAP